MAQGGRLLARQLQFATWELVLLLNQIFLSGPDVMNAGSSPCYGLQYQAVLKPTLRSRPGLVDRSDRCGDVIDLLHATETSFSFANNVLTVDSGTKMVAKLHFAGGYMQADFSLASDGHGGTVITFV